MPYLVILFLVPHLYFRFGLKRLGPINFQLFFNTGFALWVISRLWDPSEHLPFGSDMEYPHLAGLVFGMGVGFVVVLIKAVENDDESFLEAIKGMRHDVVALSIVALAGYTTFLPYSFAMYQVFTEGNYIFALLALFSIVTFLAVAHNQAKVLPWTGQ